MKRIVCLLLCLVLALTALTASADTYYSNEPEKLLRQFDRGSGIKGTLTLNASGSADWAQLLSQMNGVELQLRALDSSSGFHYRMYVSDADEMIAMTEVIGNRETATLTSDFLMGKVYSFSATNGFLSALLDLGQENTNWYTLATNILLVQQDTMTDKWLPALQSALDALDAWLTPYLSTEILERDGEKLILTRYTIPVDSVKAEMKALIPAMLAGSTLNGLLTAQASEEQAALYLQSDYAVYYQQVIDAMPLTGNLVLERTTTMKGDLCGMLLDLPVADTVNGLREISYMEESGETELVLSFTDRTFTLTASRDDDDITTGAVRLVCDEGQSVSVAYEMRTQSEKQTDEKSRNHEVYDWTITMEPDLSHLDVLDPNRANYVTFEPASLHINAHLYSKSGDTSAVTATLTVALATGDNTLDATLTLKSASPWQLPELAEGEATDISAMTDGQRSELLNDWFNNGLMALSLLRPATMTDLEAEATATDMTEAQE